MRFPRDGSPPSITIGSQRTPLPSSSQRPAGPRKRFPTIWHAAAEQLASARSADWQDIRSAETAWERVSERESHLLEPARTASELAGKLLYLLRLSEPAAEHGRKSAKRSWRYQLLESAIADAERLAKPRTIERAYERLRREFRKGEALAREQTTTIRALEAQLRACQLQLAAALGRRRQERR